MYFVPHFGHAKVYETSIWTPCFQISAKTLDGNIYLIKDVAYPLGHHENNHDGQTKGYVASRLNDNNCQADGHPYNATYRTDMKPIWVINDFWIFLKALKWLQLTLFMNKSHLQERYETKWVINNTWISLKDMKPSE